MDLAEIQFISVLKFRDSYFYCLEPCCPTTHIYFISLFGTSAAAVRFAHLELDAVCVRGDLSTYKHVNKNRNIHEQVAHIEPRKPEKVWYIS